jgi:hypothetical protein
MGAITQHYGYESAHHALLMMCERDSALRAADGCARERERERESTHHPSLMDVTATVNSALNSRRKRDRPQRERERERDKERERGRERERERDRPLKFLIFALRRPRSLRHIHTERTNHSLDAS